MSVKDFSGKSKNHGKQVPFKLLQGNRTAIEKISHDGVIKNVDQHQKIQGAGYPTHQVGKPVKEFFYLTILISKEKMTI